MLYCRLLQCLGHLNTLTSEDCSETGSALHLSNYDFQSE